MKNILLVTLCLIGGIANSAFVYSSNTFAVIEVPGICYTNTMISIPWKGYTQDNSPTSDIRIDRIVSPMNLDIGDTIIVQTNGKHYAAWVLQPAENNGNGAKEWIPAVSVSKSSVIEEILTHDGTGRIGRGYALWLIRNDPLDKDGMPKPFYLYGQWTSGEQTVELNPGLPDIPAYTMIACPDVSKETDINKDVNWTEYGNDMSETTLIIPTDSSATKNCMWDADKREWYHVEVHAVTKFGRTVAQSTKAYDGLIIPPGTGFWIVRRNRAPAKITFK